MVSKVWGRPGLIDAIIVISAVSLCALQLAGLANDPGVGWHLKTGEWILSHRSVPTHDPFLGSLVAREWVATQWLSDVVLAQVYAVGGWSLLYALAVAVYCAIFYAILYPVVRSTTGEYLAAAVTCFVAFKATQLHFILRPVLFGYLCFTLLVCWSSLRLTAEHSDDPVHSAPSWIALPALFVAWANLHPSFFMGLLVLGLLYLSLFIEQLLGLRSFSRATHGRYIAITTLCFAATFITPYGAKLHINILSLASSDFFMQYHSEWLPPTLNELPAQIALGSLVVILLAAMRHGITGTKLNTFQILSILCFAYSSMQAVRMLPMFMIIVSVPLAQSLGAIVRGLSIRKRHPLISASLANLEQREHNSPFPILLGLLFTCTIVYTLTTQNVPLYTGEYGPTRNSFPSNAITALKQSERNVILAASPNYGGSIVWYGWPEVRPIIDDRNMLLGEKFYRKFFDRLRPEANGRGYLREQGATHLLLESSGQLAQVIRQDSESIEQEVYRDQKFVMYCLENC